MEAIDEMQDAGRKVGLIRLRLWRPIPADDLRAEMGSVKTLAVLDRAVSFGGAGGPVAGEVRSALYNVEDSPYIASFIAGLGGRDITVDDFIGMVDQAEAMAKANEIHEYKMIGVRE
jgi:pyruvate ferredoxin oxidoreductase alpha subunit